MLHVFNRGLGNHAGIGYQTKIKAVTPEAEAFRKTFVSSYKSGVSLISPGEVGTGIAANGVRPRPCGTGVKSPAASDVTVINVMGSNGTYSGHH